MIKKTSCTFVSFSKMVSFVNLRIHSSFTNMRQTLQSKEFINIQIHTHDTVIIHNWMNLFK